MQTLQAYLDEYGAKCGCITWTGWVRECIQHENMVVNKFNELVDNFKKQGGSEIQIPMALLKLKNICYQKNWCNNAHSYRNLFGDSESSPDWLLGSSVKPTPEKLPAILDNLSKEDLIRIIGNMHNAILDWDNGHGFKEPEAYVLVSIGAACSRYCAETTFNLPEVP